METLPLFPLGTVLMPGAPLPLQIFEPRYVALLTDLWEGPPESRRFGVIAIRQGFEVGVGAATALHEVGCTAVIDGPVAGMRPPFRLLARGGRRFRLAELDESGAKPYPQGLVEWLDDDSDPALTAPGGAGSDRGPGASNAELEPLAQQLRTAHHAYIEALQSPDAALPDDVPAADLAYAAVQRSALSVKDRQRVLEAMTAADRLSTATGIFRTEVALLTQVRAIPHRTDPGFFSAN